MVAVTAVWGSTFVLVRDAVAQVPPFTFIAYRFLAAALLLAVLRPRLAIGGQQPRLAAGVAAGLALFAGYGFQTVGLQYTTASNAGFITGLATVNPLLHFQDHHQEEGRIWDAPPTPASARTAPGPG
jgi:drug/metabolite transporter (DMT)-like permease